MRVSDKEKNIIKCNLTNRKIHVIFANGLPHISGKMLQLDFLSMRLNANLIDTELLIDPQVILYLRLEQEKPDVPKWNLGEEMQA